MRRRIESLSLLVLLVLVGLRPLVPESYDSGGDSIGRALAVLADPTLLRTVVFDLLILLAAWGYLLGRVLRPAEAHRRTGLEWGTTVLVLAAALSCVCAGQKRLAINAGLDWLCYPVLTIILVQLLRTCFMRRLLLAVVLASAAAQAVECFDQYYFAYEDTRAQYESLKEDLWARQGVELDSPQVELYEHRLLAHEAQGYLGHPNVAGSYLILCAFAAAAVAGGALVTRRYLRCLAVSALALALFWAAWLTGSRGALAACAAGVALALLIFGFKNWVRAHRQRAWILGWICVVGGMLAATGHGLYHGSLPSASLDFRWQYWRASAELIADHGLTGVGRENFGRHYLRYKSIESPEEISSPHNLFVQATAEWGVLGLAGMTLLLLGGSRVVAGIHGESRLRCTARAEARGSGNDWASARVDGSATRADGSALGERGRVIAWGCGLFAGVVLLRLTLLGTSDADYLYFNGVLTGVAWLIGFALITSDFSRGRAPANEVSPVTVAVVAIGLFTLLLHDLINFALFVPGVATTFFALLAYVIAARVHREGDVGAAAAAPTSVTEGAQGKRPWVQLTLMTGATVGVLVLIALPVGRSAHRLAHARASSRHLTSAPLVEQPAQRRFVLARAADPLDSTASREHAEWLANLSTVPYLRDEALDAALVALTEALQRDPYNLQLHRLQMHVFRARAEAHENASDRAAAIEAARAALRLYPQDPRGLHALADRLLESAEAQGSTGQLRAALDTYREALALDDRRPAWEVIRRFPRRVRAQIEATVDAIELRLHQHSTP